MAHSSDAGGSIRIPASECGLVGLKPSRGLVPRADDSPPSLGVDGVVTRTVGDAAAILDWIAGAGGRLLTPASPPREGGRLRVGIAAGSPGGFVPTHPACSSALDTVARRLEAMGHVVEPEVPAAWTDPDAAAGFLQGLGAHFGRETMRDLDRWGKRLGRELASDDVEVHTWSIAQLGRSLDDAAFAASMAILDAFARDLLAWWDDHDLLLTPTIAEPPPKLGEFASTREDPLAAGLRAGRLTPFTTPFNVTGQPAISIPAAWNGDGLPIGVQLAAAPGREDVLIRVGAELEAALGWADRRPPAPGQPRAD